MGLNPSQFEQMELLSHEEKGPVRVWSGAPNWNPWEEDRYRASHAGDYETALSFTVGRNKFDPAKRATMHLLEIDPANTRNSPERPASDAEANRRFKVQYRGTHAGALPPDERAYGPTYDDEIKHIDDTGTHGAGIFYRNAVEREGLNKVNVVARSDLFRHVASFPMERQTPPREAPRTQQVLGSLPVPTGREMEYKARKRSGFPGEPGGLPL